MSILPLIAVGIFLSSQHVKSSNIFLHVRYTILRERATHLKLNIHNVTIYVLATYKLLCYYLYDWQCRRKPLPIHLLSSTYSDDSALYYALIAFAEKIFLLNKKYYLQIRRTWLQLCIHQKVSFWWKLDAKYPSFTSANWCIHFLLLHSTNTCSVDISYLYFYFWIKMSPYT